MTRLAIFTQVLAIGLVSLLIAPPYSAAEVVTAPPGTSITSVTVTTAPTGPGESHTTVEIHETATITSPIQPGDVEESSSPVAKELTELAQEYWGYEPNCPSGYKVLVNNITDQPSNPDGTGTDAAGEAAVPGCFMRIIPSYWLESLAPGEQTEDTCAVFIHEYGHSLGHPHTTDPNSVMNPFTMYSTGMPPECRELAGSAPEPAAANPVARKATRHHRRAHRRVRRQKHRRQGKPDAVGARPFELVSAL